MTTLKLSTFPKAARYWSYSEVVDYLLDNNADTVVNDIPMLPHFEYDIQDLETVWRRLRGLLE